MRLRDRILGVLRTVAPATCTNSNLASFTNAPEPSVRRLTLDLERRGKISGQWNLAGIGTHVNWSIRPEATNG